MLPPFVPPTIVIIIMRPAAAARPALRDRLGTPVHAVIGAP